MPSKRPLLAAACLALVACSSGSGDLAQHQEIPVIGDKITLGMNPTDGTLEEPKGWPAKGSPEQLGVARIWDMDLTWGLIEPSPPDATGAHHYEFGLLDKRIDQIIDAGMRPIFVLYGTPAWAVEKGCVVDPDLHGCPLYPSKDPEYWSAFVHAVAHRYAGKRVNGVGVAYEIWNEPNLSTGKDGTKIYWGGTDDQLVDLTRRAYQAIKAEVPGSIAQVACCGWAHFAANNASSPMDRWLDLGGANYVDVISFHPYPDAGDPKSAADYTQRFRTSLHQRHGVHKPMWATEVGLRYQAGNILSPAAQRNFLVDTIVTLRNEQLPVVLWYPWLDDHEGTPLATMISLQPHLSAAVAAANGDTTAPPPAVCDPTTRPTPQWGVKGSKCLPSCDLLGGDQASLEPCAKHGMTDVGKAYDVDYCCANAPPTTCDPAIYPPPTWGEKNGLCLKSCDAVGGNKAFTEPCGAHGMADAGQAYDVAYCCWDPPVSTPAGCDPASQPYPQWGASNGQCLQACGLIGGTSAFTTPCDQHGKVDAGKAYDVAYCCKDPVGACDPATQPAPQWGLKAGQCLKACGGLGGTSAFTTPCAQHGKLDAGKAYDVDYCCKDPPPVCDPTTQPSPQWGTKNGQCLKACGGLGGTSAFTTPCAQHGKVDAGAAYDVDYCCKDAPVTTICDPASQPSPQWGVKNGQCLQACGVIGGTSAFTTPCAQNGKVDAGAAYDVAYCCKDPPPTCNPSTQPSPQWGVKNGQCLQCCGCIGGTAAFTTPCGAHGMADAGLAYDVAYCCK